MDWKTLIQDLRGAGLSYGRIAAKCGVPRSTISDIGLGFTKEPKFVLAGALLALQKRERAKAVRAAAPKRRAA